LDYKFLIQRLPFKHPHLGGTSKQDISQNGFALTTSLNRTGSDLPPGGDLFPVKGCGSAQGTLLNTPAQPAAA